MEEGKEERLRLSDLKSELSDLKSEIKSEIKSEVELLNSRFEEGLKKIDSRVEKVESNIQLQLSGFKAELYRIEAQGYRMAGGFGKGSLESPFKMEFAPQSLGNSATDPDYEIFTDRDYGL